jgi:P4 family phage/plasmid primase-like protien
VKASNDPHGEKTEGGTAPEMKQHFKPDDDQIVIDLGRAWSRSFGYFQSDWREYANGQWKRRDMHQIRTGVRTFLRNYRSRGVQVTQGRIDGLTRMLEDELHITDEEVLEAQANAKRYINLRNGLFNLETMQLEDHRPELFFTTQFDFDYNPAAEAFTFDKYLKTSLVEKGSKKPDPQLINLMLEALGYSLTARTDLKASFWLVGKRDSGKSTLVAMMKHIFGSLHATLDLNQLGRNDYMLAELVGKRVVTFTEGSSNTVLSDATYKALVGGTDEIYSNVKFKAGFAFRPEAKLWWAMNEKPRISDRSGATFQRLHIIPFNRTIPTSERIPDLEQRFIEERSGIFNWMLYGYQRLVKQDGFTMPAQCVELREKYRLENDTEATFIEECCDYDQGQKIKADALYQTYKMWCERNGFRPKNRNQVSDDWERLGFHSHKSNGWHWWHGLRMKGGWDAMF